MKQGEIIWDAANDGFVMKTLGGYRPVLLRARHDGVVCIDTPAAVNISQMQLHTQETANDHMHNAVTHLKDKIRRGELS